MTVSVCSHIKTNMHVFALKISSNFVNVTDRTLTMVLLKMLSFVRAAGGDTTGCKKKKKKFNCVERPGQYIVCRYIGKPKADIGLM